LYKKDVIYKMNYIYQYSIPEETIFYYSGNSQRPISKLRVFIGTIGTIGLQTAQK